MKSIRPTYRLNLRAKILLSGHKTIAGFARKIEVNPNEISRVIGGHIFPRPGLQRKLADGLNISLENLAGLL